MAKGVLILFFNFACFVFSSLYAEGVFLIEQEFVKMGKKDLYETLRKQKNKQLAKFPMLAFQGSESSEYIYLTLLEEYTNIDAYQQIENEYVHNEREYETLTNFRVDSLHEALQEASSAKDDLLSLPYIYYYIYSIAPGNEEAFEDHLEMKTSQAKAATFSWKCLKTTFGSELPKYILCFFFQNKEDMEKRHMDFSEGFSKILIRNRHEGKASLRKDLSFWSSGQS